MNKYFKVFSLVLLVIGMVGCTFGTKEPMATSQPAVEQTPLFADIEITLERMPTSEPEATVEESLVVYPAPEVTSDNQVSNEEVIEINDPYCTREGIVSNRTFSVNGKTFIFLDPPVGEVWDSSIICEVTQDGYVYPGALPVYDVTGDTTESVFVYLNIPVTDGYDIYQFTMSTHGLGVVVSILDCYQIPYPNKTNPVYSITTIIPGSFLFDLNYYRTYN